MLKGAQAMAFDDTPTNVNPVVHPVPVMVGKTDRRIFWSVILAATIAQIIMFSGISSGLIALAANLPIPMTITATTLTGTNFHLYPGVSQADNATPVAINTLDGSLTNQVISKSVTILGKTVTLKLTAGTKTPATVTGLVTDVSVFDAGTAHFQNLILSTNPAVGSGFDQRADNVRFNNITITSPYLSASSITLPDLSLVVIIS
jgi:hypothetical protein